MELSDPLAVVSGIGPVMAKKLERLNLFTVDNLIHHFPFRFDDFSSVQDIREVNLGEKVTLRGEIWSISNTYTRTRKVLTKAILNDGTSPIEIVWFNQPWLTKNINSGDFLQISGKADKKGNKLSVVSPQWEKVDPIHLDNNQGLHTGRLVPVYPETYGVTSKWLRQKIAVVLPRVINQIEDPIPPHLTSSFLPLKDSLNSIHFPENWQQYDKAKNRLSYEELFYIQLATHKKRLEWRKQQIIKPFEVDSKKLEEFVSSLPFELTKAQKRVIGEIAEDLKKSTPMNRLVQGEVGSGKTVVATAAIYLSNLNKMKVLLMAPTEILAFQHFSTIEKILGPYNIKVGIYTGSKKAAENCDVIVGTHALLSNKLLTENVGLIIIDEQQRFGVEQRSFLRSKAQIPHFLSMTATPIPRTVALTLYGDLDISVIDEMPKGRQQVKTYVVPDRKRDDAYGFISKKIAEGDQVYIITPLIEESETNQSAKAAKIEFERLSKEIFPQFKIGLLHGRLKSKEKEAVINDFKDHKIDCLVSTSVVEVGVDVPNATIMLIEGAEHFGLAQLHQLRGRVGRGEKESFCLLFSENGAPEMIYRLKNMEKIYNGLELAELDLKIRGSGDIFGVRQSGRWDLKIASLADLPLIQKTRSDASNLLEDDPSLDKYPQLLAKLREFALENVMPD